MFHDFSKPPNTFIRDMVYGIQATGDTILTDICKPHALKMEHLTMVRDASRSSKENVVTGWRIEETIRFVKQCQDFENIAGPPKTSA